MTNKPKLNQPDVETTTTFSATGESININMTIPTKQFKDIFATELSVVKQPNPTLSECIKEWNENGFDVDIYAVEIVIHNYSTVDKEEHGIEFTIKLEHKTLFMEGEYNSFPYDVIHLLSKTLKALEVKEND